MRIPKFSSLFLFQAFLLSTSPCFAAEQAPPTCHVENQSMRDSRMEKTTYTGILSAEKHFYTFSRAVLHPMQISIQNCPQYKENIKIDQSLYEILDPSKPVKISTFSRTTKTFLHHNQLSIEKIGATLEQNGQYYPIFLYNKKFFQ